jgi:hypothetical protein
MLRHTLDFHVEEQRSYVLAWFERGGGIQATEWVWHMHRPLAEALVEFEVERLRTKWAQN